MEISFKTKKLKTQLTNSNEMKKAYGQTAKKVNQRMKELRASENLEIVMNTIPAAKCHELKGDRKGEFAVSISGNYRLVFIPDHDPVPRKHDNSIDCIRITKIKVLSTEDYH